jgi:hypothetical protein
VAAVAVAAVATAASAWIGHRPDESRASVHSAQRPAADDPVQVVKAPSLAEARQQPASCGDCGAARSMERRL